MGTVLLGQVVVAMSLAQDVCSSHSSQGQIDQRVDNLIARMSVEERILQLQDRAPAIPRLDLPAYNWWNEGLHGIARNGYATVFPQAIGLAATWDAALMHSIGDVVSTEARAKFNVHSGSDSTRYDGLTLWSPNINIFRDPRWGRGQETYGEDPFLTATLGTQFVEGVQGSDSFYLKADATPKHFVAHSGPEEGRDSFDAKVSAHDLADTYLSAFHALITKANASAMMCSYNAIDGTPSCANAGLLQTRVRDGWGFGGYVVSDCDAVGNIAEYHHYTPDLAHGAAAALNAGVDLDCGNSYAALRQSLSEKLTTEQTVNRSLHRLLIARLRLGMMDAPGCSPYNRIGPVDNDTVEHRALALHAAEESIVLLKNDGILPLRPSTQTIAVIGPTADRLDVLEANYHGTASEPITPLNALLSSFPRILYAQGSLLATGVSAPIPRSAFRTRFGPDSQQGLQAKYYASSSFTGSPAVTKIVPDIDLDLDRVGPDRAIVATHYAARWEGVFVPPAAGEYALRVSVERCWDCSAHDRFRLFVDGKLVIDNDGARAEPNRFALHCDDTGPHSFRLEFAHTGDDEGIAMEWEPPAEAMLDEAVATARKADVIVAFVGLSPGLEGEAMPLHIDGFAGGDRTTLDLPASQRTLLERLEELHKPMAVVLNSGSAVALGAEHFNALLEAWYPGEEGGHAVANILAGVTSPSAKLPVSFYRSTSDLPAFSDYSMAQRTYRYFSGPVLYPFGFGLSYSRFEYGPARLSTKNLIAGQSLSATITVRNIGTVAASDVAELYIIPPQTAGNPHLALSGMQRLNLAAGESREITFLVDPAQLSFVDLAGNRSVRSGEYRIFIGGAQPSKGEVLNPKVGTYLHISGVKSMDF